MEEFPVVKISARTYVAPEIPEIVKFLGSVHGIWQIIVSIEKYSDRNLLPGKG